jgi:hypothetical protein
LTVGASNEDLEPVFTVSDPLTLARFACKAVESPRPHRRSLRWLAPRMTPPSNPAQRVTLPLCRDEGRGGV